MRSKRRVIGIIIAVVFVFLMSTFLLSNNLIEAQETKDKQFTSIQVQKGDTLWKIAKKYMGNEYSSVDDYIEEVCQTNHIYDGKITEEVAVFALELLEVDRHGLDQSDRTILRTIIEKFAGGPVGLDTLAAALGEDAGTLEDVYEPYLLQNGFLNRTSRGRVATQAAYKHLGIAFPE